MSVVVKFVAKYSKDIKRKDPVKSIEYDGPDSRYAFDLTYLNKDI